MRGLPHRDGSRGAEPKLGSPGASANWWNLHHGRFAPSHALMRVMADLQERSERIVEHTVDNVDAPVPHAMEGTVEGDAASAPAVTYAAPSTVSEPVDPAPPSMRRQRQ